MGKIVLNLVSRDEEISHVQVLAKSPSFSAVTSFRCDNKILMEFGQKIKGFPRSTNERAEYVIGAGKGKAEFNFKTIGGTTQCELWVRLNGLDDDEGKIAEAHFPIDYLEPDAIAAFAADLVKMSKGTCQLAELNNRFEKNKVT